MNSGKLLITFAVILSFYFEINAQTVIRGPYLQLVTTQSINIHWRTSSATNSWVWYGNAPNNLNQILSSGSNVTNHNMLITGLAPNTTYYYAVGNSSGQMEGGDNNHYFKTSPPSNTNQTIRAWVLGNAGNDLNDQTAVRDAYYNYIGNNHIDLMLLLGDNAYTNGTDSEYQEHWFENMYEGRLINSVMWSAYGNRDALSADSETQTGPYFDIFNFPKNAQAGGVASGTEAYYSYDYGNIHFISLNSEDDNGIEAGSPMFTWLENDLNSTDKPWKVVMFHHPPYTGTSNNESDTHPNETAMREIALPILEAAGVDLVFGSHHHSYQRSHLIHGHYDVSGTWDENTMGIDMGNGREDGDGAYFKEEDNIGTVYIVAGSTGSTGSDPCCYPAMFAAEQQLGSVALEVTELEMDVKFINDNGSVVDYFTITKGSGEPTVNITYPSDNQYFGSPQTITITADASDVNGTISKVDFFINNSLIGTDVTSPYSKSWTIPASGNYEIKAVATDNSNLTAFSIVNVEVGNETCVKINASANDAEESATGSMSLTSGDLEIVHDANIQKIGLRFTNLNIPQGAEIISASIQFTCEQTNNVNPCNLTIYAQNSDSAPIFTTSSFNISSRPKTTASVNWSPGNWLNVGNSGPAEKTVDISSVIQEVVNRAGFTSSSPIVIIINGIGRRSAESFNGSVLGAAQLCINFSMGAPPVDCPNIPGNIGDSCNDGNPETSNDVINSNCVCMGTYDCPSIPANIGDSCNDGNAGTYNDAINSNCNCVGIPYDCPLIPANIGASCNDGNAGTYNDAINSNCECVGIPYDCPLIPANIGDTCNDGDANTINDQIDQNCACTGTPLMNNSVCTRVISSPDDAEEKANGTVSLTSSDLELIFDGTTQTIGLRFINHNIPQGAIITNADIQFTVDQTDNVNPCDLVIYGQASDNAATFGGGNYNISTRPKTVSSAAWSPANWLNAGDAGPAQKTVNIAAVIQEVVNRSGYTSNSAIVIIIQGTGKRTAESFNGSASLAPELCVDYNNPPQGLVINTNSGVVESGAQLEILNQSDNKPERSFTAINIFPNPATDKLIISFKSGKEDKVNIQIMDTNGRLLVEEKRSINTGDNDILLDNLGLNNGIYFIRLSFEKEVYSSKFTILN